MVAIEGDVEGQVEDAVVARQVVSPPQFLATKLNRRGEETEHSPQNRKLNQHRNTTAHRADASLLVEFHCRLLLFHCILLTGILLVQRVNLGFEHTHLGRRLIRLVGQREDDGLDNQSHNEDNPTEAADELAQEIEEKINVRMREAAEAARAKKPQRPVMSAPPAAEPTTKAGARAKLDIVVDDDE